MAVGQEPVVGDGCGGDGAHGTPAQPRSARARGPACRRCGGLRETLRMCSWLPSIGSRLWRRFSRARSSGTSSSLSDLASALMKAPPRCASTIDGGEMAAVQQAHEQVRGAGRRAELLPSDAELARAWPSTCTGGDPRARRDRGPRAARRAAREQPRRTSCRCCGCWRTARPPMTSCSSAGARVPARQRAPRHRASRLLRSYRLGHAWLWERWSQALQERVSDSGELAPARTRARRSCSPTSTRCPTRS